MTNTDALRALLARVEAASGPDREINREIEHVVCGAPRPRPGFQMAYPSRYTESLDAAVALVERIKPNEAGVLIGDAYREMSRRFGWHMAHTRPNQLAQFPIIICIKLLNCLIEAESN